MNRLKIIPTAGINATEPLDMFEQQSMSFNYQLSDIRDIFKQGVDYSKTVKIPSTPRNDDFFNYNFEVMISNASANGSIKFNPTKKINCYVNVDSETIFDGNIQLLNINIVNGLIQYEVMLRGNSINFSAIWKNVKLEDYIGEYYEKYNHNRNRDNVFNNIEFNTIFENGLVVGGPSVTGPSKGYAYYVDGRKTDDLLITKLADMTPGLFVLEMLENVFKKAGYELSTESLLDTTDIQDLLMLGGRKPTLNQQTLNQSISNPELVLPTNGRQVIYNGIGNGFVETGPVNSVQFQTVSSEDNIFVGDIQFRDDLDQWDEVTSRFVAAENSTYDIKINLPLNPVFTYTTPTSQIPLLISSAGFEIRYEIRLLKNDGTTTLLSNNTINPTFGITPFQNTTTLDLSLTDKADSYFINETITEVTIQAGEQIQLEVFHNFDGQRTPFNNNTRPSFVDSGIGNYSMKLEVPQFTDITENGTTTRSISQFEVTRSSSVLNGTNDAISVKSLLPDMKVYDFFSNIKKMYNLLIIPDELNKTVILSPREEYFNSKDKIIDDWEIDEDSEVKLQPMSEVDFKQYEFTYIKDSDNLNNVINEVDLLGSKVLQIDTDFSNKTNKLKVGFSLPNTTSAVPDNALIKFNEDGTFENVDKVKPRVAYWYNFGDVAYTLSDDNQFLGIDQSELAPRYIETIEPGTPPFINFPLTTGRLVGSWKHRFNSRPTSTLEFNTLSEARAINSSNVESLVNVYDRTFAARYNYNNPSMGLYNKYYAKTFNDLTSVDSKLMTANVKLTPTQIKLFDFRDIVRLKGVFWRVNKIMNYDPLNGDKLTKVEFIRVFEVESASNFIPKPSDALDTSGWTVVGRFLGERYYLTEEGVNPTETQCNGANGTYNSNGRCYLLGPSNPFPGLDPGPFGGGQSTGLGRYSNVTPYSPNGFQSSTYEPATKKPMVNHSAFNTVLGTANRLSNTKSNMLIVGNDNYAKGDVGGAVVVIGNNIEVTDKQPTLYLGNVKINEDGLIFNSKEYITDAGADVSWNIEKQNLIDIIDGTIDSVRNSGGDNKTRLFISNNPNNRVF